MSTRCTDITHSLQGLGHIITGEDLVLKVMYLLNVDLLQKWIAFEKHHDLSKIFYDELMRKLTTYEV